ncbi:hypothetical protein K8T06_10195, partial [bacterium]|nr:hypothetical protein [bacterium]
MKKIFVFIVGCVWILTTDMSASVLLFDLQSGISFDLTETIQHITGLESIEGIVALDISPNEG